MKYFTIMVLLCFCLFRTSFAQVQLERSVIGSGGSFLNGTGVSLSQTIGEPVTTTLMNPGVILTQGFQQPTPIFTGLTDYPDPFFILIYPNPAVNQLQFEMQPDYDMQVSLAITDVIGRRVFDYTNLRVYSHSNNSYTIDISTLSPSLYFLQIRDQSDGQLLKAIQFVKTQ